MDRAAHEHRRVVVDLVAHALGKALGELLHGRAHLGRQVERIRSRELENRDRHRRLAVEHAAQSVGLRTELESRDVAQVRRLAVCTVLDDDVLELLLGLQSALRVDDVLELRPRQRRLAADLARRDLYVLLANGGQYLIDVDAARGELAGIEP